MSELDKALRGLSKITTCPSISVSKDQYEAIESIIVAYMLSSSGEGGMGVSHLPILDEQFNRIFNIEG